MKNRFRDFQFKWEEHVGRAGGCDYLTRWVLVVFGFGLRLHHWTGNDDQRFFHDHAWKMLIFVLKGGYTDVTPEGREHLVAGDVRLRPARHKHTVVVDPGGAWTLVLTGPGERYWGFWVPGRSKLLVAREYFKQFGHHQCD